MGGVNGMRRRSRENLGTLASGKGNVQCHSHCPVFCLSPAKAIGPALRAPPQRGNPVWVRLLGGVDVGGTGCWDPECGRAVRGLG